MRVFRCDSCGSLVYFENVQCLSCRRALGFAPELETLLAAEPESRLWQAPDQEAPRYRACKNYAEAAVCNWLVDEGDPSPYCRSCRLTLVIPDQGVLEMKTSWYRLEAAKRRLLCTLLRLKLPFEAEQGRAESGLRFQFLADVAGEPPILTGHNEGTITINVAEVDDAERERRRRELQEPYRTLLGHFRHESGHFYWDRLLRDTPHLDDFRETFGDERADYGAALAKHHSGGPPSEWEGNYISAYASAHPWEDWAETWAHYLHMVDALETARASGLSLKPGKAGEPALRSAPRGVGARLKAGAPFEELVADWVGLTHVLNNLNRGLGLADGYPFVLSQIIIEKLRFVHDLVFR